MKQIFFLVISGLFSVTALHAQSTDCGFPTCGGLPGDPGFSITAVSKKISVFPSPSTGNFYLALSAHVGSNVKVLITDMTGKHVEKRNIDVSSENTTSLFKLGNQPSGVYLIIVRSEKIHQVLKVNITH